jgi:hypothetical protein
MLWPIYCIFVGSVNLPWAGTIGGSLPEVTYGIESKLYAHVCYWPEAKIQTAWDGEYSMGKPLTSPRAIIIQRLVWCSRCQYFLAGAMKSIAHDARCLLDTGTDAAGNHLHVSSCLDSAMRGQAVALHHHGLQAQRVKPVPVLDFSFFPHVLRGQSGVTIRIRFYTPQWVSRPR